jgi:hypothetical protein
LTAKAAKAAKGRRAPISPTELRDRGRYNLIATSALTCSELGGLGGLGG